MDAIYGAARQTGVDNGISFFSFFLSFFLSRQHNANVKALDHEGRTCLTFARVSNCVEVIELLTSSGCPEGAVSVSTFNTLNRRKTSVNLASTSTTNLIGKSD